MVGSHLGKAAREEDRNADRRTEIVLRVAVGMTAERQQKEWQQGGPGVKTHTVESDLNGSNGGGMACLLWVRIVTLSAVFTSVMR